MIVDPIEALKKTMLPIPVSSASASASPISPIPTVIPDLPEYQKATADGERTLWVVFVVMLIASLAFTVMSWSVPVSKRLYHVVTALITITAALSYFAMAAKDGISYNKIVVRQSHDHVPDTYHTIYREVYYARYIDWSLTTPLLLLDLSLLAGLNGAHILMAIVADVVMVLTGLFAAYGAEGTGQKWGWYTIACIAYLVIVWHLAINGRAVAQAKGGSVGKFYFSIASFTILVWTAYPVIWGIADGSRILSVNQEIIAYAVLDILAKPIFGAWLLLTHAKIPETGIELGGFWSYGLGREGSLRIGDEDGA